MDIHRRYRRPHRFDYWHIPVFQLTARAGHKNQVEGLACGADAYLTKPFSMQVPELYTKNLITSRQTMRQKYGRKLTGVMISQPPEESSSGLSTADQKFMKKLLSFVDDDMDDPEFKC